MKKTVKMICILLVVLLIWQFAILNGQLYELKENIVRLHVVANSDSNPDQSLKLLVKDEVVNFLNKTMKDCKNIDEAKIFLTNNIKEIESIADGMVCSNGYDYPVTVSLREESFDTRHYDTFSLPAGVYDSLRIEIGEAEGQNWWCVVFPTLCVPVTSDQFVVTAVESGMDNSLATTLMNKETYNIRFYFMEKMGIIENFLFGK